MKKEKMTEVVFILDKSGSMNGKEDDVIGGFNSTVSEQKKNSNKALVTTVLFSDDNHMIHDRVDIREIKDLTRDDYKTDGCTALIDAIGDTITHIKTVQKYVENKPEKTLFVIMTDGLENASHKYSSDEVKKMIEQQKEMKWEFIFMGANIDAVETAKRYGIEESRACNFATKDMSSAYRKVKKVMNIVCDKDLCAEEVDAMLGSGAWKEE